MKASLEAFAHKRRTTRRIAWTVCVLSALGCDFITGSLEQQAASATDATEVGSSTGTPAGVTTETETATATKPDEAGSTTALGGTGEDAGGTSTGGETMGPPEANDGSCCEPSPGAGCADPDVQDCVCEIDPFCCDMQWDELCADLVSDAMCGACEDAGECCEASLDPGCGNTDIEDCVCDVDPYCCSGEWDATCAAAVVAFGCGSCPLQDDPSCCLPHVTGSCEVPEIADCVCAFDEYCCEVQWDEVCVSEVDDLDCGACDGSDIVPLGTGSGTFGDMSTGVSIDTGSGTGA